ncbi:hypothetical protein HWE04_20530 [Herbaspirillum sp. C7C2]|uniref:hypothetical protein n=1 Tax=Herbaspirillum sp. C7C2 TaxID=2736666 RepID=UPI001F521B42|nr:hypothetical protein [Herbaspirillum sp. C7C2]MCI1016252.1 hypothetical protein [Herbaspirillum sp. C7C2]
MSKYWVACRGLKKLDGVLASNIHIFKRCEKKKTLFVDLQPLQRFAYYRVRDLSTGLEQNACYAYDEDMWFRVGHSDDEFSDRLDLLAKLVGYAWTLRGTEAQGPFYELFSYGWGLIDTATCKKLAADFALWKLRAEEIGNVELNFYDWYIMMERMFLMGADNGAVRSQSS